MLIITFLILITTEGRQFTTGPTSLKMKDPLQKFKISYLNSVWNFFIISNFKSSGLNSKGFMGRKIFSLTNKRVDFCQISSSVYIEGIFCKSSNQIYKPIEICNFVLWYHEGNNSANVYYDLAYPNKIVIKRIRNLKVKQVHFSFVENRRNTEHGVLEKASWEQAGDSLDLILMDPSNSGRISAS